MQTRTIHISQPMLDEADWQALRAPILSGWVTQGPEVARFEALFAARHGVRHALANSNGTTSLHLALAALGVGPGDEVIVPAFTWVATANAAVYCGATPVFVDVDPATFNLDPALVARAVTARTRALVAVHLFGRPVDVDALANAAPGVALVEDAACAAGAAYKGRAVGGLGRAAAFSFHPRKSITTGEGGMVTTDDAGIAARIASMRNHGAAAPKDGAPPYRMPDFDRLGYNYRMTDIQGALGCSQLAKLDRLIDERAVHAADYARRLAEVPWLRLPTAPLFPGDRHGWQSYVVLADPKRAPRPRDEIMARLLAKGIHTRPGTHAVTTLGYYVNERGVDPAAYPAARLCAEQSIAIPLHNRMTPDDYEYVVQALLAL